MNSGILENEPHCPHCKTKLDGYTSLDEGSRPTSGDVTVCVSCSSVLQFTDGMGLKLADADIIAQVDFPMLQKAQQVAKMYQAQSKAGVLEA